MSGAVAAHAAHNGSGTQGLAVTNKVTGEDGDVQSVFWNKNDTTRQLLHGSSIVEVQSSGASTLNFTGSRLFTINNDIDCLGDLYLQIGADLPLYGGHAADSDSKFTTTPTSSGDIAVIVGDQAVKKFSDSQAAIAEGDLLPGGGTATAADVVPAVGQGELASNELRLVAAPGPFTMYELIERIEFQVGTQVWQTLEKEDIRAVNSTELDATAFEESANLLTPDSGLTDGDSDKYSTDAFTTTAAKAWIVIPGFSKTIAPMLTKFSQHAEDGYPMAAAPHQSVKVKVVFAESNIFPDKLTTAAISSGITPHSSEQVGAFTGTSGTSTSTGTAADLGTMKALNKSLLNSRFKIQENAPYVIESNNIILKETSLSLPAIPATELAKKGTEKITSCRLFAKQIVMCNEEREAMKAMPLGMPKRLKMTQNARMSDVGTAKTKTIDLDHFSLYASHLIITGNVGAGVGLQSAELKLNSSSFSGVLPSALLDAVSADSMGLYANKLIVARDSEPTVIATTSVAATRESFMEEFTAQRGDDKGFGTFIFPLASRAYGGSSVPLNRFDSIRLTLTFSGAAAANPGSFINVTCVGKTTALFKDGAASLAMY